MPIKITNLPFALADDAIQAGLKELFSSYGEVEFYRPIETGEDGDDKVAYVALADEASEEQAVAKFDRTTTKVFPNPIRLGMTRPNTKRGQLPPAPAPAPAPAPKHQ